MRDRHKRRKATETLPEPYETIEHVLETWRERQLRGETYVVPHGKMPA